MVQLRLMTDDLALGERVLELVQLALADAVELTASEPTRLNHRSGGLRAVLDLRPANGDEQLATALRLRREQYLGGLLFSVGDAVELAVRQRGHWVDEELEAEGEDARVHFNLPAGTRGRVVTVRDYPGPLPYVVLWDVHGGPEIGVAQHDLQRASPVERVTVAPLQCGSCGASTCPRFGTPHGECDCRGRLACLCTVAPGPRHQW
ncbi:hypothetical protein ACIRPK_34085 [Kitasatospora sp. NPDC101801]|uniref:hypothetical protein n=1 Tax=Kitasatospora sp. NPDC101801 TaxID=3364103 RepID=UPI0038263521